MVNVVSVRGHCPEGPGAYCPLLGHDRFPLLNQTVADIRVNPKDLFASPVNVPPMLATDVEYSAG